MPAYSWELMCVKGRLSLYEYMGFLEFRNQLLSENPSHASSAFTTVGLMYLFCRVNPFKPVPISILPTTALEYTKKQETLITPRKQPNFLHISTDFNKQWTTLSQGMTRTGVQELFRWQVPNLKLSLRASTSMLFNFFHYIVMALQCSVSINCDLRGHLTTPLFI